MSAVRTFLVDGRRVTLAEFLTANADDPGACEWARSAKPGDFLPGVVPCECAGPAEFTPVLEHPWRAEDCALAQQHPRHSLPHNGESEMTAIKIEKGIPIPPKGNRMGGLVGAMRSLEVGDSLVLPSGSSSNKPYATARDVGIKVTTRKQPDGSIRVWRIA